LLVPTGSTSTPSIAGKKDQFMDTTDYDAFYAKALARVLEEYMER
jgi:hypothetical protein